MAEIFRKRLRKNIVLFKLSLHFVNKSDTCTIDSVYIVRMRWAGHVARMGEERGVYGVLVGKPEGERDHWGDLGVDGWIILRWISRRWDVGIWTGLGWPRIETGGGPL